MFFRSIGSVFTRSFHIVHRQNLVEKNEKKRFGLKTDEITGKEMIRAHQGHSIQDLDIEMREITDPKEFPTVLHGTYRKHWSSICNKVGLNA